MTIEIKRNVMALYSFSLNQFYINRCRWIGGLVNPVLLLLFSLTITVSSLSNLESKRLHAPIDALGKPLSNVTLRQPLYGQKEMDHWANTAVAKIFDFSSEEIQPRLAELRLSIFSEKGYESFYQQIEAIDLLSWLRKGKRFSFFNADSIRLERSGVSSNGRYKWRYIFLGKMITVEKGIPKTTPFEVTLDIQRVSRLGTEFAARVERILAEKI